MKLTFRVRQVSGENDRIGIIPPQPAVLPVATEVLPRRRHHAIPGALDVVRAARAVDETRRRPDRMIAAEEKRVARAAHDRLHPATVRLDPRRVRIVETAAVHRAPEVRVELEVRAAPLLAHRRKETLEMLLDVRMRAVERVPRAATPASERHAIGAQRRTIRILDEPLA